MCVSSTLLVAAESHGPLAAGSAAQPPRVETATVNPPCNFNMLDAYSGSPWQALSLCFPWVCYNVSTNLRLNWSGLQFVANAAIGCSSLNLMLRPYVTVILSIAEALPQLMHRFMIWRAFGYVRIFLILATVGQWVALFRGQLFEATWCILFITTITVIFSFSVMNVDGSCGFMVVDHSDVTILFVYSTSQW